LLHLFSNAQKTRLHYRENVISITIITTTITIIIGIRENATLSQTMETIGQAECRGHSHTEQHT